MSSDDSPREERQGWKLMNHFWFPKKQKKSASSVSGDSGTTRLTTFRGMGYPERDPDPERPWYSFWEFLAALVCFLLHPHASATFALQVYYRGGAFAAMFAAFTVLLGGPLLLFEAALGQCTMAHPVCAFRFCPLVQGLGLGMVVCVIMMLAFESLPLGASSLFAVIAMVVPHTSDVVNATVYDPHLPGDVGVPGSYYLYHVHVGSQHYLHGTGTGTFREYLMICMLFSWMLLFMASVTNSASYSKVVFFAVLLPLQLFIGWMLTAALQFSGAVEGIKEVFKISMLPDFEMAMMALMQTLATLGCGCGMVIHMGSLARFRWPRCSWWAYLLALGVAAKEVMFAGLTAAALGANAAGRNASVHSLLHMEMMGLGLKVLSTGLEFISFAEFWKIFVFVMFWIAELYYALLLLRWAVAGARVLPWLRRRRRSGLILALVFCLGYLGFGIFCCFRNTAGYGMTWDLQQPKWALSVLCLTEMIAGVYCYGLTDLLMAFKEGMGYFPDLYTRLCWLALPIAIITATLVSLNVAYDRRVNLSRLMCARVDCIEGVSEMIVVMVPAIIIGLNNIRIHTLQGNLVSLLRPQHEPQESPPPSRGPSAKTSGSFITLQHLATYLRGNTHPVEKEDAEK